MSDRELLELAAKAAWYWSSEFNCPDKLPRPDWNPLDGDGDALRLAVKLGITLYTNIRTAYVLFGNAPINAEEREITAAEEPSADPYAATRRAIVRAAAEIGRGMGGSKAMPPNVRAKPTASGGSA